MDKYSTFFDFISKYIKLNSLEKKIFSLKLTSKKLKKGEIIINQGDICEELYFLNYGLARAYRVDLKGKDYTWLFFYNDDNSKVPNLYPMDYESLFSQIPAKYSIEVLEDCELISLKFENMQYLYKHFIKWERFGRLMGEEAFKYLHKEVLSRQMKDAQERYYDFKLENPSILRKIPQQHIASFLGITAQHLSRLNKLEC